MKKKITIDHKEYEMQKMSIAEYMEYLNIAEFMDKSPKTIDNALQRIKAKTRQLLEEMRRSDVNR